MPGAEDSGHGGAEESEGVLVKGVKFIIYTIENKRIPDSFYKRFLILLSRDREILYSLDFLE